MNPSLPLPFDPNAPIADPLLGAVVAGRYKVLRVLGEGGMGVVYEAEQVDLGRAVALKTLHAGVARKPEAVTRFQREAQSVARVKNPHIVEVFELNRLPDGTLFIAMEFLKGRELAKLVRDGPLPIGRAVRIAMQLCDALIDVHQAGIVHRDLKPDNIYLVPSGSQEDFVKVLDFGISKMVEGADGGGVTNTRSLLGTPAYMSPEQAGNARHADHRADLYAVGGILYRSLAGRTPFVHEDFHALIVAVIYNEVPDLRGFRPDVPAGLAEVIHRCLAKEPDARPPDARALREALAPYADVAGYVVPAWSAAPNTGPARASVEATPSSQPYPSLPSATPPSQPLSSVPPQPASYQHSRPSAPSPSQPGAPMMAPIIVQTQSSGLLVLLGVLGTLVLVGALGVAGWALVLRTPGSAPASSPTTAAAAVPRAPGTAVAPNSAPAPAAPPRPAAAPRAPSPAPLVAAPPAARPSPSEPERRHGRHHRDRDTMAPSSGPVYGPSGAQPAPAPRPSSQGVLVHSTPANPFE
ncbi:MAG: protein kinase [Deltaproteobacteria bacterium]|nr:protein kinase [Deltaproteobacteria bacterium]